MRDGKSKLNFDFSGSVKCRVAILDSSPSTLVENGWETPGKKYHSSVVFLPRPWRTWYTEPRTSYLFIISIYFVTQKTAITPAASLASLLERGLGVMWAQGCSGSPLFDVISLHCRRCSPFRTSSLPVLRWTTLFKSRYCVVCDGFPRPVGGLTGTRPYSMFC